MAAALTATLRADITQFEKVITQADTTITGLQRSTAQINRELAKFGNDFGGATLIRQANLMAKAVEDIGGVTKLTANEQRKLAGSVDEALLKYRALGQEVPPSLVKISSELDTIRKQEEAATRAATEFAAAQKKAAGDQASGFATAGKEASGLKGVLAGLGPTVVGALSVGAVTSFAKEIIDLGGEIKTLSERTGLSFEAVQEFKYAAESSGSSVDAFAGAVTRLSDKIVSGDKGAAKAVRELGLELSELRNLSPEDAFTQVADAIGKVPDPMKQTQLALELFGKSGAELLPAIKSGFSDLRQEARDLGQVLNKDAVKALADFGDAWTRTMTSIKVASATAALDIGTGFKGAFDDVVKGLEASGPLGAAFKSLGTSAGEFFAQNFRTAIRNLPGGGLVDAALGFQARGQQTRTAPKPVDPIERFHRQDEALGISFGGGQGGDTSDFVKQIKAVREELGKLTDAEREQIKAAKALDISNEQIAESLNAQHKGLKLTKEAIGLYLDGVKQADSALKQGFTANLRKAADEAVRAAKDIERLGGVTKLDAKQREEANKILFEGVRAFRALGQEASPAAKQVKAFSDATFTLPPAMRSTVEEAAKVVAAIIRIQTVQDPKSHPWLQSPPKLIDADVILRDMPRVSSGVREFGDFLKDIKKEQDENDKATKGWLTSIGSLAGAFAEFAQISGSSLDSTLGKIAQLIGLMNLGAQNLALGGFRDASGKFTTGSVVGGSIGAAGAGIAAFGALKEATDVKGRGNRAARGAVTGAGIGLQIAGPYGALAGAAIGALVGAFRNPAFEDVYNRVAKNFGVKLSDETAKAIANLAKTSFKNDRQAAEVFSLDTIIAEGGGLKDSNVAKLQARLRDAFSLKGAGKFSQEQLDEILTKNFGTFANYVQNQTTIASKGFSELLTLAKQYDATTEDMRAFAGQQAGIIGAGVEALAGPLLEQFGGIQEQIKAAEQKQIEAANKVTAARGGKADKDLGVGDREAVAAAEKERAQAAKELADLTEKLRGGVEDAQQEFNDLGIIALAGIGAARDAGLSYVEAVDQAGPGLDRLVQLQKDLGLEGSAALDQLLKFRDLVGQNETLVTSAEALNETVLALSRIGGLTVESLAAMEGQGLQTFERLREAGFSENQALELMGGFLENIKLAHEQLGVPIDENTQALLDQAEAQGILKDAGNDTNSILKEGIGALIKAIGGELPEAWTKAAKAAKDSTRTSSDGLTEVQRKQKELRDELDRQEREVVEGGKGWKEYRDRGTVAQEDIRKEIKSTSEALKTGFPEEIRIKVRFDVEDAPAMPSGGSGDSGNSAAWDPTGQVVQGPNGERIVVPPSNRQGATVPRLDVPTIAAPRATVDLSGLTFVGNMDGQPVLRFVAKELPRWIETRTGQRAAV